jgi:DNA (cytosine-5)-methyltransferase 1
MTEGTRSNLWVQMREAINVIRPRLVVWENVRGAFSAPADSALEPCPGCVGDGDDGPVLRALGRVLGDLADLGYDARWYGLRAADVGAAHGRFRVFLAAVPADADDQGLQGLAGQAGAAPAQRRGHAESGVGGSSLTLLPTPTTQPSTGNGHARNLGKEARLLPTPSVADGMGGHLTRSGDRSNELLLPGVAKAHQQAWGQYAAAIARAEQAIGRPAPPPTEIGPKGAPRLSPRFVEFLMMLPEGWVTDVTGLTRNDQLKMLGNGVVPAQCAAALRAFLWDAYGIGAAA